MELRNHLLQFCRPGSIERSGVSFTGHSYAQLKGIIAMLITGCYCTGALAMLAESSTCEQRSISSLNSEAMFGNFQDLDQYGSTALRTDCIPPASRTYGVYFYTHTGRVRYEHFTEKGIHRAKTAYTKILLIGRA